MSNDHVTKPNASAFDEMHLVWKLFWVAFGGFFVLFWSAVFLGAL
ncbi:hypothetical protein [Halorussus halophilus]|nr:hypothetical protein [Halorussus halophilus]